MSEETARALTEALAAAARAKEVAGREQRACLARVADGLPGKIDSVARRLAQAEPEVTKSLGRDGVERLRAELRHEADVLATGLRHAAAEVEWSRDGVVRVQPRDVHGALFGYLYGPRLEPFAQVMRVHGYASRSQAPVLPQDLYEEDSFGPLAAALTVSVAAEREVDRARKADDKSTVDDLWDG